MEQDEKFENQLNLALDLSEEERERSKDLDAGYDKETDQWVRHNEDRTVEYGLCDRLYKRRRVGSIWGK